MVCKALEIDLGSLQALNIPQSFHNPAGGTLQTFSKQTSEIQQLYNPSKSL